MAKKRASPQSSIQRQRRAIKQKRGQGRGPDYQAFIQVRRFDFSSHGRSHIWRDPLKSAEKHHLLSDLERFVLLQALSAGAEVRVQFPLCTQGIEREFALIATEAGTEEIACHLGIKHPMHSESEAKILTTDFLLRFQHGVYIAMYVKYQSELSKKDPRRKELEKIERAYWLRRNVIFLKVTDKQVKVDAVIEWLDWAQSFRITDMTAGDALPYRSPQGFIDALLSTDANLPMRDRINSLGLRQEITITIVKYCLWCGLLKVDYRALSKPDLSQRWRISRSSSRSVPSLITIPELRSAAREARA